MIIVDSHVHILPQQRLDGLSIWLGKVFEEHPLAGNKFTPNALISELRSKCDYVFNLVYPMRAYETESLNLFNYNLANDFEHVIPFGSLHVDNDDKPGIVERCVKEYGFRGFKLHPYVQRFSPDDERLFPAYQIMEDSGCVINIHTGFDTAYPKKEKAITLSMMEALIKRFSSLTFILPHMFYPELDDALYLLETYENVFIDTTNIFSAILQDEVMGIDRDKQRETLSVTLNRWSKRAVFGTDHPAGMSDLDTIYSDFLSFDMKKHIREDLQYNTAYSILTKCGFCDHCREGES